MKQKRSGAKEIWLPNRSMIAEKPDLRYKKIGLSGTLWLWTFA